MSSDTQTNERFIYVTSVALLKRLISSPSGIFYSTTTNSVAVINDRHYWYIKSSSGGTTTTLFKSHDENCVIHSIWGVK